MKFKSIAMTIAVGMTMFSAAQGAQKPLDKDFLAFWPGFKGALQKNDKEALASMTKLPYGLDEKKLNRAEFIAQCGKIFPAATRRCLLKGQPIADKDDVFVFCGDDIFIFAKVNGKYKFTEIGVND